MKQLNEADSEDLGGGDRMGLPGELAEVEHRRQRIQEALDQARAADESRRGYGIDPNKKPAQVATTDPDSRVMPNKEGGFATTPPWRPPTARGFIVDCDVLGEVNEGSAAAPSVDRIKETFGEYPEKFLTDGGNNSGQVMQAMADREIEFYAPAESNQPQPGDVSHREDPTEPVPQADWPELKGNAQKKLDKSNFIYVAEEDRYYCPQGHALHPVQWKGRKRGGRYVKQKMYRCEQCAVCPLASACMSGESQRGRTITRDEYEEVRERVAARMRSESGRAIYSQRSRIAETPFGIIKSIMGLRQFLLRGLDKVKTEWLWTVTAFNLIKLARTIGQMRAGFVQLMAKL